MFRRPLPTPMPMAIARGRQNLATDRAASPTMPVRNMPAPMPTPMPVKSSAAKITPVSSGPLDEHSTPLAPTTRQTMMPPQQEMPVRGVPGPGTEPISLPTQTMKKGGKVKKYAKGGSIDGCAQRGKTKGKVV